MVLPSHYAVTLAGVVDDAVRAAGYNPHKLETVTKYPRQSIARSLAGTRPFAADELHAIATAIGCKVSDFTLAADTAAA